MQGQIQATCFESAFTQETAGEHSNDWYTAKYWILLLLSRSKRTKDYNWLLRNGVMCAFGSERLIGYISNMYRSGMSCLLSCLRKVPAIVNHAAAGKSCGRLLLSITFIIITYNFCKNINYLVL